MNHTHSETMANREELGIIRGARAGDAGSQLALGKLYLFGGASLPRSLPTALHWLNRAALQEQAEAWRLIGQHIPFEQARLNADAVLPWYEKAWDAGVSAAGLVLAQLVLSRQPGAGLALRRKALLALQVAARQGAPEAQQLLADQAVSAAAPAQRPDAAGAATPACSPSHGSADVATLEQAWEEATPAVFLHHALPLARALLRGAPADAEAARASDWPITAQQTTLLARCAAVLPALGQHDPELHHCRELAAYGGDRLSQLALGLWFARMDVTGERLRQGIAAVNFKRAIRWLTLAGEQGLADAWYALSRIYLKPEFSQRCVAEAQRYLERAADMGHCAAQRECGMYAWRMRRTDENADVRAAYWLQKAALQGCARSEAALTRLVAPPKRSDWAATVLGTVARETLVSQPLLAARMELAELFGLSRAEALLLDVKAADQGHCLLVDIRARYGRSKRRLVLLRTAQERQALDRIQRLFESIDSGPDGVEGNYRQRLYRLKTWLPLASAELLAA